jgi:hypothetical protein
VSFSFISLSFPPPFIKGVKKGGFVIPRKRESRILVKGFLLSGEMTKKNIAPFDKGGHRGFQVRRQQ